MTWHGRLAETQLTLADSLGQRAPGRYLADARRHLRRLSEVGPLPFDEHESQRFSQNGEDGVIAELVRRVGGGGRRFVEVGAADGAENCTRALAEDGWSGWWVEADPDRVAAANALGLDGVTVVGTFALRDSIAARLADAGATADIDVLVVDIDGDDVGILAALLGPLRPRIVVVEYNAAFPPPIRWALAPARCNGWDHTFRHGASLQLLADTAVGYRLVHCDRLGVNAFFVRDDVADAAGLAGGGPAALYRPAAHSRHPMGHVRNHAAVAGHDLLTAAEVDLLSFRGLQLEDAGPFRPGAVVGFTVEVVNGSDRTVVSGEPGGFQVVARWVVDDEVLDEVPRTPLPYPLPPRSTRRVLLWMRAPTAPGVHRLRITGVAEQVAWLEALGHPGAVVDVDVEVAPA